MRLIPPKGGDEDKANAAGEVAENEEETEEESEGKSHAHRD